MLAVCTLHADLCECVDIRRLVQYGVLNRVLRRVHAFPLAQPPGASSPHVGPVDDWRMMQRSGPTLSPGTVLDGRRHMDSLCCELEVPLAAAERAVLEAFPDCVWVHR